MLSSAARASRLLRSSPRRLLSGSAEKLKAAFVGFNEHSKFRENAVSNACRNKFEVSGIYALPAPPVYEVPLHAKETAASVKEVLENKDVAAAFLAPATELKVSAMRSYIDAKKHIFVENPISDGVVSAQMIESLLNDAEKAGKVLYLSGFRRYEESYKSFAKGFRERGWRSLRDQKDQSKKGIRLISKDVRLPIPLVPFLNIYVQPELDYVLHMCSPYRKVELKNVSIRETEHGDDQGNNILMVDAMEIILALELNDRQSVGVNIQVQSNFKAQSFSIFENGLPVADRRLDAYVTVPWVDMYLLGYLGDVVEFYKAITKKSAFEEHYSTEKKIYIDTFKILEEIPSFKDINRNLDPSLFDKEPPSSSRRLLFSATH